MVHVLLSVGKIRAEVSKVLVQYSGKREQVNYFQQNVLVYNPHIFLILGVEIAYMCAQL